MYKKRMLQNKYNQYKTPKTLEKISKQRHFVTPLKRTAKNKYFIDRRVGGCSNKSF